MIKLENVSVTYNNETTAVDNLSLSVEKGEFVGIIGSSGSGKSSLLKSINHLVKPSAGKIHVADREIGRLNSAEMRKIRRKIGFVFQDYNLVDKLSVLENTLSGRLGYKSSFQSFFALYTESDYELAMSSLEQVGLKEKMFVRGDQLSGGQKQRVAIAKTLCQSPNIILADEPVASLDITTAKNIMTYFKEINDCLGITIMINLHDVSLAKAYCSRIIALKEGKLFFDKKPGDIDDKDLQTLYMG
jgi:phosphonate transport system ATP-binding protein